MFLPATLSAGEFGGAVTVVGGSILGLYALYRKARSSAGARDARLLASARRREQAANQVVIDDLRGHIDKMMSAMEQLQQSTTSRIIAANDMHHECERKHAALEAQFKAEVERRERLEQRVKALEGQP